MEQNKVTQSGIHEVRQDLRYPCTDTRLAACLCSLGFPLKKEQPFLSQIIVDAATNVERMRQTTIWLEPTIVHPETNEEMHASTFGIAWMNGIAEWASINPGHPFTEAYRGIMARNRIVKEVVHARMPSKISTAGKFRTDDLTLSACLEASGFRCLALIPRNVASRTAHAKGLLNEFYHAPAAVEAAKRYDLPPSPDAIQWQKLGVMNYHLLNERIRKPDNVPCITKIRELPGGERRELILPVNMPDEIRRTFESYFYA